MVDYTMVKMCLFIIVLNYLIGIFYNNSTKINNFINYNQLIFLFGAIPSSNIQPRIF